MFNKMKKNEFLTADFNVIGAKSVDDELDSFTVRPGMTGLKDKGRRYNARWLQDTGLEFEV